MALLELLGENSFDQGFTICMAWLTIEVAAIIWDILKMGATMLIAKSPRSLTQSILRGLPTEALKAEIEKRESDDAGKTDKGNGKKG